MLLTYPTACGGRSQDLVDWRAQYDAEIGIHFSLFLTGQLPSTIRFSKVLGWRNSFELYMDVVDASVIDVLGGTWGRETWDGETWGQTGRSPIFPAREQPQRNPQAAL